MARTDGLSGPIDPRGSGSGPRAGRGAGHARGQRRAPRRLRLIFAGVLLLLLLEIVVLIAVGNAIGPWWTVGLLLLFVVVGGVLVRRESSRTWRALRGAVETGRMPGRELADASLVLVGGLLMLLPGFISDVIGLLLILPFTRGASRRLLAAVLGARVVTVMPGTRGATGPRTGPGWPPGRAGQRRSGEGDVIEGEIVAEEPPPGEDPPHRS